MDDFSDALCVFSGVQVVIREADVTYPALSVFQFR